MQRYLDLLEYGDGDIFAAFLADGKTILCSSVIGECVIRGASEPDEEFWDRRDRDGHGGLELMGAHVNYNDVSLSPDGKAIAVALEDIGVAWLELGSGGRRTVVGITDNLDATAVAALEGSRVAAGLSNGDVWLIDAVGGEVLRKMRTRETKIVAIVRLRNGRIAVASQGSFERDDRRDWEILIVSLDDLSISERLTIDPSMVDAYEISQGTRTIIERLAASGDGRWLVAALRNALGLQEISQLWDTSTLQATAVLGSRVLPVRSVEFDEDDNLLLVDSPAVAALWNLKDGLVTRRFRHRFSIEGEKLAALTGDAVVYGIPGGDKIASWSNRTGLRTFAQSDERPDSFRGSRPYSYSCRRIAHWIHQLARSCTVVLRPTGRAT